MYISKNDMYIFYKDIKVVYGLRWKSHTAYIRNSVRLVTEVVYKG